MRLEVRPMTMLGRGKHPRLPLPRTDYNSFYTPINVAALRYGLAFPVILQQRHIGILLRAAKSVARCAVDYS
jgi:hypothetical protein